MVKRKEKWKKSEIIYFRENDSSLYCLFPIFEQ